MKRVRAALAAGGVLTLLAVFAPAGWAAADTTPPSVPSGMRVVAVTDTTITVEWTPSTDPSGVVQYWTGALPGGSGEVVPTEEPRHTFTGLAPNTHHSVIALAVDGAGNYSAYSESLSVTTRPDIVAPSVPGSVRVAPELGHATVSWTASTDNHRVERYEVAVDGETAHPVTSTALSSRIRNMAPATTHTFQVRAADRAGNRSALSAPVRLTMPDAPDKTAPAAPSGLTNQNGVFIWNPATDNADPADALEYAVHVGGFELAFVGRQTRWDTLDPVLCVSLLLPGTHTYTVRATDRSGNQSAPSNGLVITQ